MERQDNNLAVIAKNLKPNSKHQAIAYGHNDHERDDGGGNAPRKKVLDF